MANAGSLPNHHYIIACDCSLIPYFWCDLRHQRRSPLWPNLMLTMQSGPALRLAWKPEKSFLGPKSRRNRNSMAASGKHSTKWWVVAFAFAITFVCLFGGISLGRQLYQTRYFQQLTNASGLGDIGQLALRYGVGLAASALLMLVIYFLLPHVQQHQDETRASRIPGKRRQVGRAVSVGGLYLIWRLTSILWPALLIQLLSKTTLQKLDDRTQHLHIAVAMGIYLAVAALLILLPVPLLKKLMRHRNQRESESQEVQQGLGPTD